MTWKCNNCGQPNFMDRTHCSKCGLPRGAKGRRIRLTGRKKNNPNE